MGIETGTHSAGASDGVSQAAGVLGPGRGDAAELALAGGGELGALMRATDWGATRLGPVAQWPQSLRTTVSTCLNSRFPIIVWWGPELIMLYNDAYRQILGGKHPASLGAPGHVPWAEIWPIVGPMLHGVLDRGDATWSEDQLLLVERRGFREETYFTFSYSPIRDESGGVGGVFTAVTETTERVIGERRMMTLRRLAERTLEAQSVVETARGAIEALAENAADVPFALLYLLDEDGRSARLTGVAHLDPASAACPHLLPLDRDVDSSTGWPIAAVVETGRPAQIAVPAICDGLLSGGPWADTPREALVLPVARAGQEQPRGVLVAGLSPYLPIDDAYRGFVGLVAGQVATALANAEAYEAERRRAESLAELDRAKTAFFSNVSHEFRTPLTLLLGPAEDALADPRTIDVNRERFEIVRRNALRLQRLVNTLLDFSRIEAGRVDAAFEPTDLATLTAELASSFRSAVERGGLALEVDCPPLAEPVYVDHDMWEKIVLNLLSNALKHTFEGRIVVSLHDRDGAAELVVRDTGVGIAADQLPQIFDRFHRVPNARSRSHEGTGIGLALVQELVRLHGGTITVESEQGRGSRFIVRVPRGTAHLPRERVGAVRPRRSPARTASPFVEEALHWMPETVDDSGEHATPAALGGDATSTRGARVLLADDNADMRAYVTRLLRGQGWFVQAVADGTAALDAARASRPDLVLSDVMMPGLDGFALLRALRAEPRTSGVPVVLLSARAGEESRIEGLEAGADDYLVKPFSARELVARVGAHLGLAAARARAAADVEAAHAELAVAHRRLQEQAKATQEALGALKIERARLAELFRQAPAFICVLRGPAHVVELANDDYYQLVGFRELVGKTIREALPEAEEQGYVALLDRVLATGEAFIGRELPVMIQRTPGAPPERRFLTFLYQPITEADSSRSGIFVLGMDVTDQVQARAEAETARQAAEEANRAKSDFLAAMSHELRTPLNAIGGYAQLLELGVHGPITDAQRDAIRRIQRSEQHLLALINDVLNFAKIEAGRVEYELRDVSLADVVESVAPMIEPQLAARRLGYATRVPRGVTVRADREKLQQILLNLLSNAIKFTDAGGRVLVAVDEGEDTGGTVRLRVTDTGIGIPRERQEAIFDPFVQIHRNLTRSVEGTGLGLAISRDLARGMGGDLTVESEAGVGSTFVVALPRA